MGTYCYKIIKYTLSLGDPAVSFTRRQLPSTRRMYVELQYWYSTWLQQDPRGYSVLCALYQIHHFGSILHFIVYYVKTKVSL